MSTTTTVSSGPAAEEQNNYVTLDSTYTGRIEYGVLTPTHVQGIRRLYIDEDNYRRDSDIIEALHGSDDLYETYSHYAQQDGRPELIDVRDSMATWLVPHQRESLDNVLTVARIMVALDSRWSIVGMRHGHPNDFFVQGRLTESEMASLQHGIFPSTLSRLGNPARQFLEDTVMPTEEIEQATWSAGTNNNTETPSTDLPVRTGDIPSPPTEPHSSNSRTWQQQQAAAANMLLPARRPPNYRSAADPPLPSYEAAVEAIRIHIANNFNIVSPRSTLHDPDDSDDDYDEEEDLPSYRHASRRLARESRLLSADPSEVEDPAGSGGEAADEDEDGEEYVVPPEYQRGEAVPGYHESVDNNAGGARNQEEASGPVEEQHRPNPSSPRLPDYHEVTERPNTSRPEPTTHHPNPTTTTTHFTGLDGTFDTSPTSPLPFPPTIPPQTSTTNPHTLPSPSNLPSPLPSPYSVPPPSPDTTFSPTDSIIFEPTLPAYMRTHAFNNNSRYNSAHTRTESMDANVDAEEEGLAQDWVEVSPIRRDEDFTGNARWSPVAPMHTAEGSSSDDSEEERRWVFGPVGPMYTAKRREGDDGEDPRWSWDRRYGYGG